MKFCCTQSERSLLTLSSRRRFSTSSMNDFASAAVGRRPAGGGAPGLPAGFGGVAALGPGAAPVARTRQTATAESVTGERRGECSVMGTS